MILLLKMFLLGITAELWLGLDKSDLQGNYDTVTLQRMNMFLNCTICKSFSLLNPNIHPFHKLLVDLLHLDNNGPWGNLNKLAFQQVYKFLRCIAKM